MKNKVIGFSCYETLEYYSPIEDLRTRLNRAETKQEVQDLIRSWGIANVLYIAQSIKSKHLPFIEQIALLT